MLTNTSNTDAKLNYLKRMEDHFERLKNSWQGNDIFSGSMPNKEAILLNNNDYLSLSNHPYVTSRQAEALMTEEADLVVSKVYANVESPIAMLEQRYARFMKSDAVLLTQSGWYANVGLLQTIADPHTPVYLDMFAHASIWTGAELAGAPIHPFRHNSPEHLERLIKTYGPGVIAVDSVYSTNGSVCPLLDIVAVARAYDCVLVVDEAHSIGLYGDRGEGMVVSMGLENDVDFITASLSKAFAQRAGIITCSRGFSNYFKYTSHPNIFSSGFLHHEVVALDATLDLIKQVDELRDRLHYNATYLRDRLTEAGFDLSISQSHILPLAAGRESRLLEIRDFLEKHDVFGAVFFAPATAKNKTLMRFTMNAKFTRDELDKVSRVCSKLQDEVLQPSKMTA
ncbi:MAG: quorum-sensing autoinducer CAI-1 synthase [Candidatus Pacearchaeota archaeon]|nr:quorum-sensing autoinducer CAI-1 synthase [Candidatus Pacearchaeota archaeon]